MVHHTTVALPMFPLGSVLFPGAALPLQVFERRYLEMIDVDPDESAAANALMINGTAIYPANFPATAERMRRRGVRLATIDVSEIQKAEGGVTCCCIPLW